MIKQDNLYAGKEAREKLMRGVSKVALAVGSTMGTSGGNSLIECIESPGHYSTNDGFTIANSVKLSDPIEEMGRSILVESINRANKHSGDGSSTTCVLTAAILEEGMKHINSSSPMEIKRSLESLIPEIEKSVQKQKSDISVEEVSKVASVSAEDEQIGSLIQEIYQKIGKEGIIYWDVSKTTEDSYSIGTGLQIDGATYVSPYMCDVDDAGRFLSGIQWKNPHILLSKQKIMSATDLNGILSSLFEKGTRELIIFCEEIEMPIVANLIKTRIERGFKTTVIKMPVIWRDEWWEDLAVASGGTIVDGIGLKLSNVEEKHLGSFGHITVTKTDTFIDGIKDLSKHILGLQVNGDDASLLRASRLNTKTARYFVGAHSESALAYKRLKVEDAINAAKCALENGIVVGGGIALLNIAKNLKGGIGAKILKSALKEPFRRIVENAGGNIKEIEKKVGGNMGFNSRTGEVEDLSVKGIVDPADVSINAVKNAIGVAASVLSTNTIITLPREENIQQPNSIIQR